MSAGETIQIDETSITGIKTTYGELVLKLGPFLKPSSRDQRKELAGVRLDHFFTKKYNPADEVRFKSEVEKTGAACVILHKGESIDLKD